ncbi:hypothetical protein BN903_29 [Halorubrum sp. AJ67]|nr:hypothetical protein BN903_29 [Halorubrum sp. AJ67]
MDPYGVSGLADQSDVRKDRFKILDNASDDAPTGEFAEMRWLDGTMVSRPSPFRSPTGPPTGYISNSIAGQPPG